MDAKFTELVEQLNGLDFKGMYGSDFLHTWDKTTDELKALYIVADALRELREETGVEPIDENSCDIDHVGQFYSSEGMTDELANIMVVHLRHWQAVERHFDADEHVESAWIPWKQLRDTHITASNSEIAILHEQIRRMRQQ